MTEYFTSEHFKLLNKWKKQKRDDTNPEQNRAYIELQEAYEITEQWANKVQTSLFPNGYINIRKRPTSQGNTFFEYTWAKIYPTKDAPKELAYTVGIGANEGFVVKIDTVGIDDFSSTRKDFLKLRGEYNNTSPITSMLPAEKGLSLSLLELSEWSVDAIRKFSLKYDDIVEKLGLISPTKNVLDKYEIEDTLSVSELSPKNTIYYGPPGTGKTYTLQNLLKKEYTQQANFTSPKEWKTEKIANEIGNLTWWEAIAATLYALGGKAKVSQLLDHPFIKSVAATKGRENLPRQTIWGTLQLHANEESNTVKTEKRVAPYIFDKTENSEWFLYGDWKDECKKLTDIVDAIKLGTDIDTIERYSFVTFHQSYGYEEFVEGLRPLLEEDSDSIGYEIKKGAFFQLCKRARLDPNHQYAIVIDEINRGNISKIFGELITLIEIDKRDRLNGSKPPIEIKLAYSGDQFSVPANVDIIGTMNTADRSLALVDTALRRRFDFVSCMPDTRDTADAPLANLIVTINDTSIDVRKILEKINQRIEALYDRDHTIGHAYFTPLRNIPNGPSRFDALSKIFRTRIVPLLEEYFFEDWQKIRLVLADNQKTEDAQFIRLHDQQNNDLTSLFGDDNELDQYSTQKRFFVSEQAFLLPYSYVGIYS